MKGYRISEKRSQHRCARCNQVVDRLGTESAESSQLEGNLSRHESFLRPRFASGFVGLSATHGDTGDTSEVESAIAAMFAILMTELSRKCATLWSQVYLRPDTSLPLPVCCCCQCWTPKMLQKWPRPSPSCQPAWPAWSTSVESYIALWRFASCSITAKFNRTLGASATSSNPASQPNAMLSGSAGLPLTSNSSSSQLSPRGMSMPIGRIQRCCDFCMPAGLLQVPSTVL